MRRAAGKLDDFDSPLHRADRVQEHLAVFLADQGGQFMAMDFEQLAKARQDPRASQRRGGAPARQSPGSALHGTIHVDGVGQGDLANHRASGGIHHVAAPRGVRSGRAAVNPAEDFGDTLGFR